MLDNSIELVNEFIEKFEASRDPALWDKLVSEEADEVIEAAAALLKEMCDFWYVVKGHEIVSSANEKLSVETSEKAVAVLQLFRNPLVLFDDKTLLEAFKRVHESNMSKLGEDGKPIRRSDGKIIKGPNYKPPVLTDLI